MKKRLIQLRTLVWIGYAQTPLLCWGVVLLLAILAALGKTFTWLGIGIAILSSSCWRGVLGTIALLVFGLGSTHMRVECLPKGIELRGEGIFRVQKISAIDSSFGKSWQLHGRLLEFTTTDGQKHRPLPLVLFSKSRPKHSAYKLNGTYSAQKSWRFSFRPAVVGKLLSNPLPGNSLIIARTNWKQSIAKWIEKTTGNTLSGAVLRALATGNIDHYLLKLFFLRVGILPFLAISGFHYALLAGFALSITSFLTTSLQCGIVATLLTAYACFLGNSAASWRAWAVVILYLINKHSLRPFSTLNALGGALLLELLFDPWNVTDLGFQLSFAATAGILLTSRWWLRKLQYFWPERENPTISLLAKVMHNSLAVTLAAQSATIPILIEISPRYPLWSLLYPLWIAPAVGITFFLVILAVCSGSVAIIHLANAFTGIWLRSVTEVPNSLLWSIPLPLACQEFLQVSLGIGAFYTWLAAIPRQRQR